MKQEAGIKTVILAAAVFLIISCNPAKKLERKYGVNKSRLHEDIVSKEQYGKNRLTFNNEYVVVKKEITELDHQKTLFEKINKINQDEIQGPFLENDSTIYYVKKTATDTIKYCSYQLSQLGQPFGISDDLFQSKIDSIKSICLAQRHTLKEVLFDIYSFDDAMNVGITLTLGPKPLKELRPSIKRFMKTSALYTVYQTGKINHPHLSLIELVQKTGKVMEYTHISYYIIRIKSKLN